MFRDVLFFLTFSSICSIFSNFLFDWPLYLSSISHPHSHPHPHDPWPSHSLAWTWEESPWMLGHVVIILKSIGTISPSLWIQSRHIRRPKNSKLVAKSNPLDYCLELWWHIIYPHLALWPWSGLLLFITTMKRRDAKAVRFATRTKLLFLYSFTLRTSSYKASDWMISWFHANKWDVIFRKIYAIKNLFIDAPIKEGNKWNK